MRGARRADNSASNVATSFLLAWIFWRWGLPYAILAHVAANATHELLSPVFFG